MDDRKYQEAADCFKALGEPNRLKIVDMLTDGELCACNILDELKISQPTLSHHMKVLCDRGLVKSRKEGKWMHYSLCCETFEQIGEYFNKIT